MSRKAYRQKSLRLSLEVDAAVEAAAAAAGMKINPWMEQALAAAAGVSAPSSTERTAKDRGTLTAQARAALRKKGKR